MSNLKATPYTLSASDLSGSPDDVVSAVLLLQAHGFTVTREPIKRVRAGTEIDLVAAQEGDPESIRRHLTRELPRLLGAEIAGYASGSVTDDEERGKRSYVVIADIIRPTRNSPFGDLFNK